MRRARRRPRRWAVFAGVGAIGFSVQLAVLGLLTGGAGLATAPAAALAVETAVLHNFVWHERWTWRDRAGGGPVRVLQRLARFHVGAGIVSLAGNVAITVVLVEWLQVPVVLANACAVGVLSVLNFHLSDRWVFPGHPESPSARDNPARAC
jgi:putative flippase GtrA